MIIISTTAAIAAADGSINKPAKTNVLVQPCLYYARYSLYLPTSECQSRDRDGSNYPRIPSVP